MSKLLVNDPWAGQQIVEVLNGGSYFDQARVLWDERVDGPMPDVQPGGLVRRGAELIFSQVAADAEAPLKNAPQVSAHNQHILAELQRIDAKSIRALREKDQARIDALNAQAAELRLQLVKE